VAIAQLEQAIYNHEQGYRNLVRVLVARLAPDASDLAPDAHVRCRFGQWYESDAVGALRSLPAFVALGDAHQGMHRSATHLAQRVADDLPVSAGDMDQFTNLLDRLRLELESLRRDLTDSAHNRDPLTDALSRASLLSDLREQHALVRRAVQHSALVMIDIDHFKVVNDTYGHSMGDLVLSSIVKSVHKTLRPYDRLYRYGGEEFVVSLPGTSLAEAVEMAERLRAIVADERIRKAAGGPVIEVTASFGVTELDAALPVEEALEQADRAMFRAKETGRNRVVAHG
jgi:diguanylate cyclase